MKMNTDRKEWSILRRDRVKLNKIKEKITGQLKKEESKGNKEKG